VGAQVRSVGRIPVAVGSMVGRDRLIEDVVDLVLTSRVVTLTGVGGVGKTRVALEVAGRLTDHFDDGVWMVELAAVGDPDAVPDVIANALGVSPQGERSMGDAVADAIAGRRLLLIVDNCEHVADAAARTVEQVLRRSPTPKVLATSRESLWVAGEQRMSVSPLSLEGGLDGEAVTLFVERATAVLPGFGVDDPATADAVVEICRTLDGLPLAIELAAARMAAMTAIELRDRLEHRFRLLTGAAHRPERQRTLEHAVAWSYDLLSDEERSVLRAAAVFAGGFDLATITALIGDVDEIAVLAHLDALINRSLVIPAHRSGATRYDLLETIRHFAVARLAGSGELDLLRDRHAALFAAAAAAQWERWSGPGWRAASDWVEMELANLRTAFRWSVGRGRIEIATDVAAHAALIGTGAQLFEPVSWATELLDAATSADVARLPRLYTAAGYACFTGRPASAAEYAHTATLLETRPRYDACEPGLATFVEALGRVYSGDLERYVELSERVAGLGGVARAYGLPAFVDGLQASGRVDEALALVEDSIEAARDVGNPFWIAYALWTAGLVLSHTEPSRALAAWDQGVAVVSEHRVDFFAGYLARDAARVHAVDGDVEVALDLFAKAIDAFRQVGNVAQLIITVALVPQVFELLGLPEAAATLTVALMREPASTAHVPELADVRHRLETVLGDEAFARCAERGSDLDLGAAATYARDQIEIARADLAGANATPGGLSRREIEVLELVADGLTTRDIASRLFISAKTADHHIQHIYAKTGVSNRAAATRWALDHGVVAAEPSGGSQ
jgi:predicted ATPase/DNA-binding CsgD family transcriptional regulator